MRTNKPERHLLGGQRKSDAGRRCFTLLELLVVVAIIAVLCAFLFPVLVSGKSKAQRTRCISNFHQLQTAWATFESDHDALPPNNDQPDAGRTTNRPSWVAGWLRLDNETGDKSDGTNTALLVAPAFEPFGSLGPYTKAPGIYRCARDTSTVRLGGADRARVRSVSMNAYMNGAGVWQDANFITFHRLEDIRNPSDAWVFIEERMDSINDGYFAVLMGAEYAIVDTPANYHDNQAVLSFADGHVEPHKWKEPTTTPPIRPGVHMAGVPIYTSSQDQDMKWLTERSTIRK